MVKRYEYLQLLASKITDELVISTIAGTTREWQSLKDRDANLYQVYMAGATSVALGLAVALPHRRVVSLDGDGSILMGLGILPVIAHQNPSNLVVIVFDNEAYEAPGKGKRLPTFTASVTDLAETARGAGIRNVRTVKELPEFKDAIDRAFDAGDASFISVKVELGSMPIPYPALDGIGNKYRFIKYVEKTENLQIIKPPRRKEW